MNTAPKRSWRKIEDPDDTVVRLDIGQSVEGVLLEAKADVGKNNSHLYVFQAEDGSTFKLWGSTVLDKLMKPCEPGDFVRVTFRGISETSGAKLFDVEVAD